MVVVEPTGAETELLLQIVGGTTQQLVVVMHGRTAARPDDTVYLRDRRRQGPCVRQRRAASACECAHASRNTVRHRCVVVMGVSGCGKSSIRQGR